MVLGLSPVAVNKITFEKSENLESLSPVIAHMYEFLPIICQNLGHLADNKVSMFQKGLRLQVMHTLRG